MTSQECDPGGVVLSVGQDAPGHWLVQESGGRMEGRFISQSAAMSFARAERGSFPGATGVRAARPLVPFVSFAPVRAGETALARAA